MINKDSKYTVFLSLLLKHQKNLYGYLFALLPNLSVVDDLMQETIMVMWEKFDTFEPDTNFYAWAKKIAYYKVMNYHDRSFHTEVQFSQEALECIDRYAETAQKTDDRIIALEKCIHQLSAGDKKLVKLKYADGMTVKEVAEHVQRPVEGMYKAMARIHNLLEQCIKRTLAAMEGVS